MVSQALLWLEDMEQIRVKSSNLQGALSGKLHWLITVLKSIVSILSGRAEEEGASSHLQSKNIELKLRVRAQSKEITLLNESLAKSEEKIRSLESEIRTFRERISSSGSMSPEPAGPVSRSGDVLGGSGTYRRKDGLLKDSFDVKAVSSKIVSAVSAEFDEKIGVFRAYEDKIVSLMEELVKMRFDLVDLRDGAPCSLTEGDVMSGGEGVTLPPRTEGGSPGPGLSVSPAGSP